MEQVLWYMTKLKVRRAWRKWIRPEEERQVHQARAYRVFNFLRNKDVARILWGFNLWRTTSMEVREMKIRLRRAAFRISGNKKSIYLLKWRKAAENKRRMLLLSLRASMWMKYRERQLVLHTILRLRKWSVRAKATMSLRTYQSSQLATAHSYRHRPVVKRTHGQRVARMPAKKQTLQRGAWSTRSFQGSVDGGLRSVAKERESSAFGEFCKPSVS